MPHKYILHFEGGSYEVNERRPRLHMHAGAPTARGASWFEHAATVSERDIGFTASPPSEAQRHAGLFDHGFRLVLEASDE